MFSVNMIITILTFFAGFFIAGEYKLWKVSKRFSAKVRETDNIGTIFDDDDIKMINRYNLYELMHPNIHIQRVILGTLSVIVLIIINVAYGTLWINS